MIHPFNPKKIFCHYDKWLSIKRWLEDIRLGDESAWLPAPITVTVDPSYACNCNCLHCNADFVRTRSDQMMSREYLDSLYKMMWEWDVRGVVIAGGGEPLCNPHIGIFVDNLKFAYMHTGLITNGILLGDYPGLQNLDWLGVSVDAATSETWMRVHGNGGDHFNEIISSMHNLINSGVHVTYKYLVREENVNEVYDAVRLASTIGCKNFHIRPVAAPWWSESKDMGFSASEIDNVRAQIAKGKIEFPDMQIADAFEKVDFRWNPVHNFLKCIAIFTTCIFMPDGKVGFCCDRRGDTDVEIGPLKSPEDLLPFWGSKEHAAMQDRVCIGKCESKCTQSILNEFFEKGVMEDGLMLDFI